MSVGRIDFTIWPGSGQVHAHTHTDGLGDSPPIPMDLSPDDAREVFRLLGIPHGRITVVASEAGACDAVCQ